jgi:hypothetical protein
MAAGHILGREVSAHFQDGVSIRGERGAQMAVIPPAPGASIRSSSTKLVDA